MQDILDMADGFLDALDPYPGDSPQGEWPKVMLTESHDGLWHLDHELPDHAAKSHWIVKLPRGKDSAYDLILRAEAAYHAVACELGLATGETHYREGSLWIQRFDRQIQDGQVTRIAQESLYAACGCTGPAPELTHWQAAATLARVSSAPEDTLLDYLRRDLLNLALGNRDNHGRNTALERREGSNGEPGLVQLAPAFDLAPMMLHPEGLSRRMRWSPENGRLPDWRQVSAQLDEAGLLPQSRLLAELPAWEALLLELPQQLRRHDCPEDVLNRLQRPLAECMDSVREAN